MKTTRKWMSKLAALMMAVVLICSLLPVQASAATRNDIPVLCAVLDSAGEVVSGGPGIPVLSGSDMIMITDDELYEGSSHSYAALIRDEIVYMEYVTTLHGFAWFTFTYSNKNVCAPENQARVNEQCTLQAFNGDYDVVSYTGKITGYNSAPTSEDFYWVDVESNMNKPDVYAPVAVLNSNGGLVAVMGEEGNLTFAEPVSGSGGSNSSPERPQPEEPAPTRPQPEEPTENPAPTKPADPTQPTEEPDDWKDKYMIPIVGAVAVIVLAVVAVLILRKPKPAPVPPQPWTPQPPVTPQPPIAPQSWDPVDVTKPGPDVTKSGPDIWETVPESGGYSLKDSSGLLGGRTFQISPAGALIGRSSTADIQYPADTKGVSRNHCRVYVQGNSLMVIDNGSTSGTYLLGKGQLRTNNPTEVKDGDVICLGSKKISLTVKKN